MRVKFNNHIDLCKRIRHPNNSSLLLISTVYNELYTVECETVSYAEHLYKRAFENGYIDVSYLKYSN